MSVISRISWKDPFLSHLPLPKAQPSYHSPGAEVTGTTSSRKGLQTNTDTGDRRLECPHPRQSLLREVLKSFSMRSKLQSIFQKSYSGVDLHK